MDPTITEDLSNHPGLAYSMTISDYTRFPAKNKLPAGYDPDALLEWGKDPGLSVDILHKYGFTGKGSVIAYVDQPIATHEQYNRNNVYNTNNSNNNNSMHGPAVLSLLTGKDIGTAPEATVYFYGHSAWLMDQTTHAECLYQIIEQNKRLPEGEKITMVGFSDGIDYSEANVSAFEEAVAACKEAGIMVWFCQDYGAVTFLPMSDKNNPENLTFASWGTFGDKICVPDSGRTTAATSNGAHYIYWSQGGLSWTMPYALGLYSIAIEIDPSFTQEELLQTLTDTAYINSAGIRIVNPVGFVAAALKRVGRDGEAQAMLDEEAARRRYIYAIMDTAALSNEDLAAIGSYLAAITDATVLVVDASQFSTAQEVYAAMWNDAASRGGSVAGVQIFGTPSMVPTFEIKYRVQMPSEVDDAGTLLTDLFYGNFENDVDLIGSNYNVLDHFAEGWDVDLIPQWPVARLPLSKGEFTAFFEKYEAFALDTGLEQLDLVNFSNPIFASKNHIDSMGEFLKRMDREFGFLDDYRLYANLDGDYPVTQSVLGGFTQENLSKENETAPMELVINSHGQWNNIDQCIFENGKEVRISFLNMSNINEVLDAHPYYLDAWTCLNGYGMSNNLTTTALQGQCVGMFSATALISNNGVNWQASVSNMQKSNFYYFYYAYLKALHEGLTRSQAFCVAQQAYGQGLLNYSKQGLQWSSNYQFNLYNLLAYHNFGVLEPNAAALALADPKGYITQAGQSAPKQPTQSQNHGSSQQASVTPLLSDGNPVGDPRELAYVMQADQMTTGAPVIYGCTIQSLDNDYVRVTLEYSAPLDMDVSVFNPPNGDVFMKRTSSKGTERQVLTVDFSLVDIAKIEGVTVRFFAPGETFFVFFNADMLRP